MIGNLSVVAKKMLLTGIKIENQRLHGNYVSEVKHHHPIKSGNRDLLVNKCYVTVKALTKTVLFD